MSTIEFQTQLLPRGPAAAVVLDESQVATVGEGAKRFRVVATVNGYSWNTSVTRMGGEFLVGLSREVRQAAGVQAGDEVMVSLRLDTEPRLVELPAELSEALDSEHEAQANFEAMAFTHRKEYARWIGDAKRADTRQRRVAQAVEMIRAGKTRT
jgi:hypothetical protein